MSFSLFKKADETMPGEGLPHRGRAAEVPFGDSGSASPASAVAVSAPSPAPAAAKPPAKKKYTAQEIKYIHEKNKEALDLVRILEVSGEKLAPELELIYGSAEAAKKERISAWGGFPLSKIFDCDSGKLTPDSEWKGNLSTADLAAIKRWVPSYSSYKELLSKLEAWVLKLGKAGHIGWAEEGGSPASIEKWKQFEDPKKPKAPVAKKDTASTGRPAGGMPLTSAN